MIVEMLIETEGGLYAFFRLVRDCLIVVETGIGERDISIQQCGSRGIEALRRYLVVRKNSGPRRSRYQRCAAQGTDGAGTAGPVIERRGQVIVREGSGKSALRTARSLGEITIALGRGGYRHHVRRDALNNLAVFDGSEEERLVFLDGSAKRG